MGRPLGNPAAALVILLGGCHLVIPLGGCHLVYPFGVASPDGAARPDGDAGRVEAGPEAGADAGADAGGGSKLYRDVSKDGWGLRRPLFRDGSNYHEVRGIWGAAAGSIWLAGTGGWIVRRTTSGWRPVRSPTGQGLRDIWGTAADAIWIVGDSGTRLRYDGVRVASEGAGTQQDLLAIHGSASAGLWISGASGTVLGRPGGGSWGPYPTGKVSSHQAVFAGSKGQVWVTHSKAILQRQGSSWIEEPLSNALGVYSLWGPDERPLWAGNSGGQIFRHTAGSWALFHTITGAGRIDDFWGDINGNLWVAAYGGVHRYKGGSWSKSLDQPSRHFYALWGATGASDVYATAGAGNVFRYDGALDRWFRIGLAACPYLAAGGGGKDEVWLVGGGDGAGVALRHGGGGFEEISQAGGGSASLRGVWVSPVGTAWVVGELGTVLRYSPSSGLLESAGATGVSVKLRGVWGAGSKLWVCGDEGRILRLEGNVWNKESSTNSTGLNAIWGSSESDIWAVGWAGKILRRKSGAWQEWTPKPTTKDLYHLHGSGPKNVYAVGDGGTVLRFDGQKWTQLAAPTTKTLRAVWVSPKGQVWTVGDSKAVHRYAAGKWTQPSLPASTQLTVVWGRSESDIWVAASDGTVLHFDDRQ